MNVNIRISKNVFNDVYLPYLDNHDRYLVFYGGGSSGKSYFIAQRYIYKLVHPVRCNLLVVRQTGDTNRRSTFPLLKQVISNWNLAKHFKVNESDMRIVCKLTGNGVRVLSADWDPVVQNHHGVFWQLVWHIGQPCTVRRKMTGHISKVLWKLLLPGYFSSGHGKIQRHGQILPPVI